jgi:peptidoglycan/LPS O-acetylase OafA/YrhL
VRTLGDRVAAGQNNFDFIRWLAASLVVLSHEFAITGHPTAEPLLGLTRGFATFGTVGVDVFFVVSGFLVTQSLVERRSLAFYVASRVLRIVPGLLVLLLVSAFVIGAICTTSSFAEYYADLRVYSYVGRNLLLRNLQWDLPGVFTTNPFPQVVNGSLWSLGPEVAMYALLLGLGIAGWRAWRRITMVIACSMVALMVISWIRHGDLAGNALELAKVARLAPYFALGSVAWCARRWIPFSAAWPIVLSALTVASFRTPAFVPLFALLVAATVLWFAFVPAGVLARWGRHGDFSYGLYIYAFPIQQMVAALAPGLSPWLHGAVAYPLILLCAMASWRWVESPALRLKRRLRGWPLRDEPHIVQATGMVETQRPQH